MTATIAARWLTVLAALGACPCGGAAQLVRQDFRAVRDAPAGWSLSGSGAARGALSVSGTGDDMSFWWRPVPGLRPSAVYRLQFTARVGPGSAPSTVIAGLDCCNRDFAVTGEWQAYTFAFTTPADVSRAVLRLGQWHLRGTVQFRDVALVRVAPVYGHGPAGPLGEGEALEAGGYQFTAPLAGPGSNSARSLVQHTAAFNSNRWVIGSQDVVVYRHSIPGSVQVSARLALEANYHTAGTCAVSVSRDGSRWTDAATLVGTGAVSVAVPAAILPAETVWVRLKGSRDCSLQVDQYRYVARLGGGNLATKDPQVGSTQFAEVSRTDTRVAVSLVDLGSLGRSGPSRARLAMRAAPGVSGLVGVMLVVKPEHASAATFTQIARLPAGRGTTVEVPYTLRQPGKANLSVLVTLMTPRVSSLCYAARVSVYVPSYYASDYGYRLARIPEGTLWWCEGTYKVSPWRKPPGGAPRSNGAAASRIPGGIQLYLASRESGAVQLVLSAGQGAGGLAVSATGLAGPGRARLPASVVRIRRVGYVHVRVPTDAVGVADEWPDPLPPLDGTWRPAPGRNSALWLTVTVPVGSKPGDYRGWVVLRGKGSYRVPLQVHVWGFALPERTSLRSGFGVSPEAIGRYHNLSKPEDLNKQWDLYMRDFARHRLCPFNAMALAPIGMSLQREPEPSVRLDFSAYDGAARRYLNGLGMNSFTVGVAGLGSGRHPSYDSGSFMGYAAGTPEYDRLMRQYGGALHDHLAANGWLQKAYVYWYDEPEEADYPFVKEGMRRLRIYVPGLKRMLTEEFQPSLYGSVDLWCPITPNYSAGPATRRQKLGEEVWWYVCTGPKEPWAGLFIDHPAIEMRMWLWQTWKYRVQGILIWDTTYWTSRSQFTTKVQNPWDDPMSYVDGPSGVWGNGDGRFFYPPNRNPNEDRSTPFLAEPIDTVRWEMLGEGVQDWEYFHLLDQLVGEARLRGRAPRAVEQAGRLLAVPADICTDMTHFASDPLPLYAYRIRLARAIEALSAAARVDSRQRRE